MKFLALTFVTSGLLSHTSAAIINREQSQSINSSAYDFVSFLWEMKIPVHNLAISNEKLR